MLHVKTPAVKPTGALYYYVLQSQGQEPRRGGTRANPRPGSDFVDVTGVGRGRLKERPFGRVEQRKLCEARSEGAGDEMGRRARPIAQRRGGRGAREDAL